MKRVLRNFAVIVTLATGAGAFGIDIPWFSVDGGAADTATGGGFELRATIGQPDAGLHASGQFAVFGGYRLSAHGSSAPCPGDITGDGEVGLEDLSIVLAAFGSCEGDANFDPGADFDMSGCIELTDLATLLASYGVTCP